MTTIKHGGWRNRETWLVSKWFLGGRIDTPTTANDFRAYVDKFILDRNGGRKLHGFVNNMVNLVVVDWEALSAATQELEPTQ